MEFSIGDQQLLTDPQFNTHHWNHSSNLDQSSSLVYSQNHQICDTSGRHYSPICTNQSTTNQPTVIFNNHYKHQTDGLNSIGFVVEDSCHHQSQWKEQQSKTYLSNIRKTSVDDCSTEVTENIGKSTTKSFTTTKAPKSTYKHIPHREKPVHLVARRNARERKRVQAVNSAFMKLRKCVPVENRNKRLSKVKTLHRAIEYIDALDRLLRRVDDQYKIPQHQQCSVDDDNQSESIGSYSESSSSLYSLCQIIDSELSHQSKSVKPSLPAPEASSVSPFSASFTINRCNASSMHSLNQNNEPQQQYDSGIYVQEEESQSICQQRQRSSSMAIASSQRLTCENSAASTSWNSTLLAFNKENYKLGHSNDAARKINHAANNC